MGFQLLQGALFYLKTFFPGRQISYLLFCLFRDGDFLLGEGGFQCLEMCYK